MTKQKLLETLHRILKTNDDLCFLSKLEEVELEKLLACIRDRVEKFGNNPP